MEQWQCVSNLTLDETKMWASDFTHVLASVLTIGQGQTICLNKESYFSEDFFLFNTKMIQKTKEPPQKTCTYEKY